ncbi:NXPE family member 2 [Frankliniella fusca]|uniref:NXPE family member 2 n=1 Tax=Frankliniella fusca TaxID=407009 RepID=A0AAE1LHU4_9NEOP|nr:NXPE family member 2 [Frankliniella fusca]
MLPNCGVERPFEVVEREEFRVARAQPRRTHDSRHSGVEPGRLITPRRNCLAPDTVDVLLFLFNYLKKRKQYASGTVADNG